MSLPVTLLLLRLVGAALLLLFFGVIIWLVYRDLRLATEAAGRQERPSGHLQVVASENQRLAVGTIFPLLPLTRIGRAVSATIVLDESYVSTEHALISRRGQQWWLEDLGSRNGTLLNEIMLKAGETAVITGGDIIGIGSIKLRLVLTDKIE